MRILKPLITVAILALVVFLLYQYLIFPFFLNNKAKIVHMIDPDSYLVMKDGVLQNVQLIGVDAPEVTFYKGKKIKQCFYSESKDLAVKKFLSQNREVTLESDSVAGETDIYGRHLAYVTLNDGTLLNDALLSEGLARVYEDKTKSYAKLDQFKASQELAKTSEKGLWAYCGD